MRIRGVSRVRANAPLSGGAFCAQDGGLIAIQRLGDALGLCSSLGLPDGLLPGLSDGLPCSAAGSAPTFAVVSVTTPSMSTVALSTIALIAASSVVRSATVTRPSWLGLALPSAFGEPAGFGDSAASGRADEGQRADGYWGLLAFCRPPACIC